MTPLTEENKVVHGDMGYWGEEGTELHRVWPGKNSLRRGHLKYGSESGREDAWGYPENSTQKGEQKVQRPREETEPLGCLKKKKKKKRGPDDFSGRVRGK